MSNIYLGCQTHWTWCTIGWNNILLLFQDLVSPCLLFALQSLFRRKEGEVLSTVWIPSCSQSWSYHFRQMFTAITINSYSHLLNQSLVILPSKVGIKNKLRKTILLKKAEGSETLSLRIAYKLIKNSRNSSLAMSCKITDNYSYKPESEKLQ